MTTIPPAAVRSADAIHLWTRSAVDPALRAAVATMPDSMRLIAEYHFGWSDEDGQPAPDAVTGKADRPALAMLTAEAVGAPAAAAVPAAVAVELVHNFALLRDDVIDGDLTRRHRASAWAVFGSNAAILTGDALLTLAFDVVKGHSEAAERMLTEASQHLLAGRAAEKLIYDETTVGAENDLERATQMARRMVMSWGMSERIGPVSYKLSDEDPFLGREIHQQRQFSEHTMELIDEEVARILRDQSDRATDQLARQRNKLAELAERLLEKEELDEHEIESVLGKSVHGKHNGQPVEISPSGVNPVAASQAM